MHEQRAFSVSDMIKKARATFFTAGLIFSTYALLQRILAEVDTAYN